MRASGSLIALAAFVLSGCYQVRDDFRYQVTDAPFVDDIGELQVVGYDELAALQAGDPTSAPELLYYGQLGAGANQGVYGGATFEFMGTGSNVCVVVDPEAVFWLHEISTQSTSVTYKYEDIYSDDGDLDLSVGLSAYYTGSPGTEIGDFQAVYTDPTGTDHELAFNECRQVGYFGDPAHAGRATVEFCDVDTSLREGIMFTALLETFALPSDDSVLNYGALVYDGRCSSMPWIDSDNAVATGATECVIPNEVGNADPNGLPADKEWFPALETAFCSGKGKLNSYCADAAGEGCVEP